MRIICTALLLCLAACRQPIQHVPTAIAVPDTVYALAGPIPVVLVDSLASTDSTGYVVGRYSFYVRELYVRRRITSPHQRLKIIGHEWCHAVALDSGLHNHLEPAFLELLCDAFGTAWAVEYVQRHPSP